MVAYPSLCACLARLSGMRATCAFASSRVQQRRWKESNLYRRKEVPRVEFNAPQMVLVAMALRKAHPRAPWSSPTARLSESWMEPNPPIATAGE